MISTQYTKDDSFDTETSSFLECGVEIDESCRFGKFANAFRIVEGPPKEVYLDFLIYSGSEQQASVVSRIKVKKELLPVIRDYLVFLLADDATCSHG
jgi:hypothetical protein